MKYFKGEIEGKRLSDFKQLENVKTFQERLDFINKTLEDGGYEFLNEYFNTYYKASLSQNDDLSENDEVCKMLEMFGSYLIDSSDIQSNRKVEYRFWKDVKEYNKYSESNNVTESMISNGESDSNVEVIDMFVDLKNEKNHKVVQKTSILAKDILNIPYISALNEAVKFMKSESGLIHTKTHCSDILNNNEDLSEGVRHRLENIIKNTERYLASYAKDVKENQVSIKEAITKPIVFKSPLKDSKGDIDWANIIDYRNKKCVKEMLKQLHCRDLSGSELGLVLYDFYTFLINGLGLATREKQIVLLLGEGKSQSDIVKDLGLTKGTVGDAINRIADKVVNSNYTVE